MWSDEGIFGLAARVALSPVEGAYRGAVAVRTALYERGILHRARSVIPVLSVGNLTVGGTGKTPVSGWFARRLYEKGRAPAIVLRGYGGDEPLVHARTNPAIPVVIASSRVAGISEAIALGADVVVLDDGFQHMHASRDADIVLVSADQWTGSRRMLPAGPWREPLSAIRRASVAIVTRKAASDERVAQVREAVSAAAPAVPQAVVRLTPHDLRRAGGMTEAKRDGVYADMRRDVVYAMAHRKDETLPIASLAGKRVLAIAAIGDPAAFFAQIESHGPDVSRRPFADHHAFSTAEVDELIAAARAFDLIVCTLKDAVKLAPMWPDEAAPLWYVSLSVVVESGIAALDQILARIVEASNKTART